MLPLLQENRKPTFSERINSGVRQAVDTGTQAMNQYQENKAIEKYLGPESKNMPREFQQMMLLGNIQNRSDELKYGRAKTQAKNSAKINYSDQPSTESKSDKKGFLDVEPGEKPKKTKDLISNKSNNERGIAPESQTKDEIFNLNNPEEVLLKAQRLVEDSNKNDNPINMDEAIDRVLKYENVKQDYHNKRETEKKGTHEFDIIQGQNAINKLNNVFGENGTTDEIKALAAKRGQELSREYKNQADIDRAVSKEMTQLKNTVDSLKKAKGPARILGKLHGKLMGTDRGNEKIIKDIQIKAQPLLDLGLNSTVRNILSNDLGMYPEEVESTITTLGEGARKNLASLPMIGRQQQKIEPSGKNKKDILSGLPKMKSAKEKQPLLAQSLSVFEPEQTYSPEEQEIFKNTIIDTLKANPSENLILLRKAVEDKNYDWRLFKDVIDDALINGDIKFDEDQFLNQYDLLNEPPESKLDYLLSTFGFGSR